MAKIVCGKEIAGIIIKNGFYTAELVDRMVKNEFGNSRD